MDRSVQAIIAQNPTIRPGDVFVLNAPYNGGTHLPDITVCTPVFDDTGQRILFWLASRGHHADVGGIAPGSMSPLATRIEQEGVYIDNVRLVAEGVFQEEAIRALLTSGPYPVRNVIQNINDLKAQVAANARGEAELRRLVAEFGLPVVEAYMRHVQDNAAEAVRRVVDRLHDSSFVYPMDQGCEIRVAIRVDRAKREVTVDFTGTSPQQPSNFNAPLPVTRAAVLYVFRVMVEDNIPMNAGCLRPIRLIVPEGSMLSPRYPAASGSRQCRGVAGRHQLPVRCAGALAAAQGTMNNVNFGNDRYQYYETICSGAPAGPRFDGAPGSAYAHDQLAPDRSGGAGIALPGGAGRFPYPSRPPAGAGGGTPGMAHGAPSVSLRRWISRSSRGIARCGPSALFGGEPGALGENWLRRADGRMERLEGVRADARVPGRCGDHRHPHGRRLRRPRPARPLTRQPWQAGAGGAASPGTPCRVFDAAPPVPPRRPAGRPLPFPPPVAPSRCGRRGR